MASKKVIKVKGVSMSGLTAKQQQAMKKRMSKGASFTAAHKQSQKAVGR